MNIIADCLFTVLLMITPSTAGMERYFPATWDYESPTLSGVCISRGEDGAQVWVRVNGEHELIFVHGKIQYAIPYPPLPGLWPVSYYLGADRADMGVWGNVMVRFGPEGTM